MRNKPSPETEKKFKKLRHIANQCYKERNVVLCLMDEDPHEVDKTKDEIVNEIYEANGETCVFIHAKGKWNNNALIYTDKIGWEFELLDDPSQLP